MVDFILNIHPLIWIFFILIIWPEKWWDIRSSTPAPYCETHYFVNGEEVTEQEYLEASNLLLKDR